MPIPADVLAVKRPKNTVVYVYGKDKDKYGVKERIGCKYKNGKSYPVNGKTVGHIKNGVYVPMEDESEESLQSLFCTESAIKGWANYELCFRLSQDLLEELKKLYIDKEAKQILAIAILRVCCPEITDSDLKDAYDESTLSDSLPNLPLSRNTVCSFQQVLGKGYDRIHAFMKNRAEKVGIDHHLLVDGTLKTDDSRVNTFSEFSRKARLKGSKDISVLYAFDLEKMEPICSQCFPGNMLDLTAYDSFVKDNGIKSGILVGDKGFPAKSIEGVLKENKNLHYFNPLKRSSKIAQDNDMYNYDGNIDFCYGFLGRAESIQYKKVKLSHTDKWLYSFRDSGRAGKEDDDWLANHKGDKYSDEEYRKKRELFGTVVFESDVDLTPADAWKTYSYRWQIELVMRYYKDSLCFANTRVHNDFSVIGSEFINFLSTVITFRLLDLFDKKKLLDNMTYRKVMRILAKGKKVRTEGEWKLDRMNPEHIRALQTLDLLPKPEQPEKRKVGRPRKKVGL